MLTKKEIALKQTLFSVIVFGTAVDVFWSVVVVETLRQHELNPFARWLIFRGDVGFPTLPHSGVALLCALKVMGTWHVLQLIDLLMHYKPHIGWSVASGLAVFMLYLIWFLFF